MSQPWMPLYVNDFMVDTLDLSAEENGIYLLMLMVSWRRADGALPNDMKWLKRALSSCVRDMHGNRFNRVVPVILQRFFVLGDDGKYRNKRLTNEREKARKLSEKQKENANKRWSDSYKNKELYDAAALPARAFLQSQSHKDSPPLPPPGGAAPRRRRLVGSEVEGFDGFWGKWPHKVARPAALRAFKGLSMADRAAATAGIGPFGAAKPADREWPHPATYLNQRRWEDQPAPLGKATTPSASAAAAAKFFADRLSPQWAAWDQFLRAERGKGAPTNAAGGWHFPAEWPPGAHASPAPLAQERNLELSG